MPFSLSRRAVLGAAIAAGVALAAVGQDAPTRRVSGGFSEQGMRAQRREVLGEGVGPEVGVGP
jgi:hypothetical protein